MHGVPHRLSDPAAFTPIANSRSIIMANITRFDPFSELARCGI